MARHWLGWTGLLTAAQAGDVLTTWAGFRLGAPEENPLVQRALAAGSFPAFGAIKLVLVAGLLALLWYTRRYVDVRIHLATWRAVQALAVIFTGVAALNAVGMAVRLI